MAVAGEALGNGRLVGDGDIHRVDQQDAAAPAGVVAAAVNRDFKQVFRLDAQPLADRGWQFFSGVIERQFDFGKAQHGGNRTGLKRPVL